MKIMLETERLILREKNRNDVQNMINLNSNPLVVQYTGDAAFENEAEAEKILDYLLKQYKDYGYARWAVELKDTREFLGWCGLKYHADKNEVDIGYRLLQQHWGKGYATEAAAACINYGFEHLQLKKIVGHAMKANTASIRVFEKLGMQYVSDAVSHCSEGVVYSIES